MTYKELLKLYKNGELSAQQREEIEKEIEKQEAISEYLFDNEQIPEFSEFDVFAGSDGGDKADKDKDLLKMIKKSIRRAFIKAGVTVGIVVLALVVLATTTLPHIVDAMYYDPAEVIGEKNGAVTNRLTLDTAVYTELFTPGYYRTHAFAGEEGFGKYDIQILQNFSFTGQFNNVNGTIDKGRLTLYDDTIFKLPTHNAFWYEGVEGLAGHGGTAAAGSPENALRKLEELDEIDHYLAYVTFDKVMTYDEMVAWSNESGITPEWAAICEYQSDGVYDYYTGDIIGFNYSGSCSYMVYNNEKYPYLNYFDMLETTENFPEEPFSAQVMTQHVTSMLSYMMDNEEFRDMVGCISDEGDFIMLKENVEQHGLNIYGFTVTAQRDTLLEISKNENVQYIYTTPIR